MNSSAIEEYIKSLDDTKRIDFACWLASKTIYGQQELVDWHKDVVEGISSYDLMFKHFPANTSSLGAVRLFFVSCKGKTKEDAIEKYKRGFDKERWRTVEYVGG